MPSRSESKDQTDRIRLDQHKLVGKRLVSPWNHLLNISTKSWVDDRLPESLWAIFCRARLPRDHALAVFRHLAIWGQEHLPESSTILCLSHSDISQLDAKATASLSRELRRLVKNPQVFQPLLLLPPLPDYQFWRHHTGLVPDLRQWEGIRDAVARTYDHQSEEATDVRWQRVLFSMRRGRLQFPRTMIREAQSIANFPYEGDMREVRPRIRATEMSLCIHNAPSSWPTTFWRYCLKNTSPIVLPFGDYAVQSDQPDLKAYGSKMALSLSEQWHATRQNSRDAKHDVVFGIGLACARAAEEIGELNASQSFMALATLRFMAEGLINLAFLLTVNSDAEWIRFRQYAAGRAKLLSQKAERDSMNATCVDIEYIDAIASEDKASDFIDIEFGDWSKESTRTRAEKGGCKDIYDHYFDYGSLAIHANWFGIGALAYSIDGNVLHRGQRVPRQRVAKLRSVAMDVEKLLGRILNLVDSTYPGRPDNGTVAHAS